MMSKLQLSDGTVVILDETKLEPGQVCFLWRLCWDGVCVGVVMWCCGSLYCDRSQIVLLPLHKM